MGMAEDIAHIRFQIEQMTTTTDMSDQLDSIQDKLRHDIEPKLDKALEGKTGATEATQEVVSMDEKLRQLKLMLIYAADGRKIEAIKALRTATNAGLKEAKDAIEWIEVRLRIIREQAVNTYKDENEKEAE